MILFKVRSQAEEKVEVVKAPLHRPMTVGFFKGFLKLYGELWHRAHSVGDDRGLKVSKYGCSKACRFRANHMLRCWRAQGLQQSFGKSCACTVKEQQWPCLPTRQHRLQGELKKPVRKCFKQNQTEKIILRRKRELFKCNLK